MSDPNPESTVADVSWLSALARTLTRDGALADDLVQETWLIARRASPEAAQSRPWLARVLRRLHLRSRRTESRRAAREKASGRSESLVGTAELVERAELQRVLAQSLLELEEPYRTTLMRVAFEGYSTARIAEAESVSVETVRRRLRRARELYARKLEHDHGHDWRHWYAALLPYAKVSPPSESSPPGPEDLTLTGKSTLSLKAWIMSNSTLLTVSALVAGIVAASLALFADRQDASPNGRPEIALGRADDVEPLSVPSPSSPETPARREPMTGAASVPDPAAVDRTTAPLSYVLRGTLTMRDAEGLQNPSASGSFALWTSTGTLQVPVERGAWSVELAPDQEISFRIRHDEEVRMDGRIGWLTGGTDAFASKSVLDRDTEIALRGRWPAEHRLLVLDAETGAHLSGVQVIECSDVDGAFPHPSSRANGTQVHENALSPLRIVPRARHRSDYLVGCSGFAWTTIALDHDEPGTTEVALRPGADLTVRFGGEESGPIEFAIQELGDPRRRSERGLASTDPVRLQGLPTGNYLLQARAGMRAAVVQAEVELLAGPNEVELDLPRRSDATVSVAGTLSLTDLEKHADAALVFDEVVQWELREDSGGSRRAARIPLASMVRAGDDLRFDAGVQSVGEYVVSLEGSPWRETIRIGPEGATDLRFVIGSAGVADVRLVDFVTGEPIERSSDDPWTAPQFELGEDVTATFVEERNAWRIQGPMGSRSGQVMWFYDFKPVDVSLELRKKPEVYEFVAERHTTFRVTLHDGEERLDTSPDWIGTIRATHASEQEPCDGGLVPLQGGWGFAVERPGPHRVTFGAIEGFEPIPEMVLDLARGEHQNVRVDVRRK